jgi:hypothetical protein
MLNTASQIVKPYRDAAQGKAFGSVPEWRNILEVKAG